MNGSLKKSARTLYVVCACIIVLMVICYFGVSNSKGTYSADDNYTYSCGSGWTLSSDKQKCCFGVWAAEGICCASGYPYYVNGKCNTKSDGTGSSIGRATIAASTKTLVSTSGACYTAAHMYQWFTSKPSGSWTKVERSQSSCKGCESGYTLNDDGECVLSSGTVSAAGCYTAAYMYQWFDNKPSGDAWTKVSVTKENCKGCVPGYTLNDDEECVLTSSPSHCYICLGTSGSVSTGGTYKQSTSSPGTNCHLTSSTTCSGTPVAKKYECTLTDNSKVCVTAYDSAWASADVGETGTSCKEVTSCSPTPGGGPTSGGGTNPPSSSSSSSTTLSSSSSNVDDNPKTGSVAIFIVWVIALGTLIYSFVYFKQSKFE